jgi:pyrimidine-nucleoside phosphorylase
MEIALAALRLGAGRAKADDGIDHAVGITALMKIGERVEVGAPLCRIHANDERAFAEAKERIARAIVVGDERSNPVKLVNEIIG